MTLRGSSGENTTMIADAVAKSALRRLPAWGAATALLCLCTAAEAQIGRPGAHNRYAMEVEPHLVFQWPEEPVCRDEGIGLGGRLSFPIMDDGPVPSINNSFAIGVGADLSFFDGDCYWRRVRYDNGDGSSFWVPVNVQWNLFFAETFSAFMELGLAINHQRAEWCDPGGCYDDGDTDVDPVLWFGGRVHATPAIAFTFRLGHPSLQLGASFFL